MYNFLLIVQVFAILVCLSCVILLFFQRETRLTKLMLITVICGFIQNFGYLLEMTAKNLETAMAAVKIEYAGGAFVAFMLTLFIFTYSEVKMPKWFWGTWFALCCVVFAIIIDYQNNTLYYTKVEFIDTGMMPHLVLHKGILYIIFAGIMYASMVCDVIISIRAMHKTVEKNRKANFHLLIISCILPLCIHLLGFFGALKSGYDMAPLGVACAIAVFAYAIIKQKIFDVVGVAHEGILTNMEDAIIIVGTAYAYMEANESAKKLFPELTNIEKGGQIPDTIISQVFSGDDEKQIEIGEHYYNVHVNAVKSGEEVVGHAALLFDVTESKHQFERMCELKDQADRANMAKSLFLANMSHEIRTPINVILGMNEVILRDFREPKLNEYSENIRTSAQSLLTIVNGVLDFSKIEAGKLEITPTSYDVRVLLGNLINIFKERAEKKKLQFITEIDEDIPHYLIGDAMRIQQIIINILDNAIKYTNDGHVTLRAVCRTAEQKVQGSKAAYADLIISVEDSGIGIMEEDIPRLFTSFERMDEQHTRTIEGIGLGLNITQQLVKLMDGELKVYSVYGQGSVFTVILPQKIYIPQALVVDEVQENDKQYWTEIDFTAPKARILLVDDSRTNLMVAEALLSPIQADIATALSGRECIELVGREHFDLIFLDHRMPDMDGIETLQQIKATKNRCADTPIIVLTANAVNDAKDYYLELGFDDFLSKPIDSKKMEGLIKQYLPHELIMKK